MTIDLWLFVFGALGFVDGWLACWWLSILTQRRANAEMDRRNG